MLYTLIYITMLGGSNDKRICMFCEGKIIKKNIGYKICRHQQGKCTTCTILFIISWWYYGAGSS